MQNVDLTDSDLDRVLFDKADLTNTKFGKYPDLIGHGDWINDLAITKDNKKIVSSGDDCLIKVWNFETTEEILSI